MIFLLSVQFSCSFVSDSLWPHEFQHASLSITNSWSLLKPMSIESVMPSSHLILCCPLLFLPPIPSSIRVFPVSWFFASSGQSIGASASASVLLMNIQGWFPLGLTGLIFLQSKGLSRVFSSTTTQNDQFFGAQPFFMGKMSHLYMTTGKTTVLTIRTFVSKVMSLLFNALSSFVIAFLPRNNFNLKIREENMGKMQNCW